MKPRHFCDTCAFWRQSHDSSVGECWRSPPRFVVVTIPGYSATLSQCTTTKNDDGCGEHSEYLYPVAERDPVTGELKRVPSLEQAKRFVPPDNL